MTLWVLDKSAHVRLMDGASPPPEIDLADLVLCEIGELEWLYSARSAADYDRQRSSIREVWGSVTNDGCDHTTASYAFL